MVFKEAFDKKQFNKINFTVAIILSILYASLSALLLVSDFAQNLQFGDIRPAIFFPALVSILFGPIIGMIAGGFGNLLYDIFENIIIEGGSLTIKNLVGFLANLLAGLITGGLAYSAYDKEDLDLQSLRNNFSIPKLWLLLKNTVASIIGFGFIVGYGIGLGLYLVGVIPFTIGMTVAFNITLWNSIALLVGIPTVLVILTITWFYYGRKSLELQEKRRQIDVTIANDFPIKIVSCEVPVGDELKALEWGAINMLVENPRDTPTRYYFKPLSTDVYKPLVHTTPVLKQGEKDQVYFNVYTFEPKMKTVEIECGIISEHSHAPYDTIESKGKILLTYEVSSSLHAIIHNVMNFAVFIGLLSSLALVSMNLYYTGSLTPSPSLVIVLIIIFIEFLFVYVYYWSKKTRVVRFMMGVAKKGTTGLVKSTVNKIRKTSLPWLEKLKRAFYVLGLVFLLGAFWYLYLIILKSQEISWVYPTILASLSFAFLIAYEILFETTLEEENVTFDKNKFIQAVFIDKQPVLYQDTKVTVLLRNTTESNGLRVFLNSLDHVFPIQFNLKLKPGEETTFSFAFVPIGIGTREISFELVEYLQKDGSIVPLEKAKTFDQESVILKVSKGSILGLTPSEISFLKKFLTATSIFTISVIFVFNYFNIHLNTEVLSTFIPLLFLLQAPVILFSFYMSNKTEKALQSME